MATSRETRIAELNAELGKTERQAGDNEQLAIANADAEVDHDCGYYADAAAYHAAKLHKELAELKASG